MVFIIDILYIYINSFSDSFLDTFHYYKILSIVPCAIIVGPC